MHFGRRSFLIAGLLLTADPGLGGKALSREHLSFAGAERTYYVYAPDTQNGPPPVIVLLHGTGGNGLFMLERWRHVAAREKLTLLAPDSLHSNSGWVLRDDGPDFIRAVVLAAAAKVPMDPRRIYLFGQSGGAAYALTLGMLESEYFAAVAFHAGGWRRAAEYKFVEFAKRKIPVSMWVGDEDTYFPLPSVRNTERVLVSNGFPAELHILKGRTHSYRDVNADFNDSVWDFLRGQSLTGLPVYTPYRVGNGVYK
jgi:poly(3-hydroxybutyrate) depolymerase